MVKSTRTVRSIALLLAVSALMLAGAAAGQFRKRPGMRRGMRPAGPGRLVGKAAPDFNLPVLKEVVDDKGGKVNRITDEKVRLSAFRGKKLVCVFFSSYT